MNKQVPKKENDYRWGILLLIFAVSAGMFVLTGRWMQRSLTAGANRDVALLIGSIQKTYPDVKEQDLIRALQGAADLADSETHIRDGQDFFRRFGFEADLFYSADVNAAFKSGIRLLGACFLGLVVLLSGFGLWQHHKTMRKIRLLTEYTRQIGEGEYHLTLSEEEEHPISALQNEIYRIMTILRESAGESKKRQENLTRALADISHQIRTPLTSAGIMLDELCEDPQMPAEIRMDFLSSIRREQDHISTLVVTLLQLAKLENGTMQLKRENVSVGELLKDVQRKLAVLLEVKNLTLELSGDLSETLYLDPKWESEALTNLVKNAAEHSPDGTAIQIDGKRYGLFYTLTVKDHGEGIAREDLPHIFERFYKAKNSSPESIGIGLAFAKAIIEADHGSVTADSAPGEGTVMKVRYRMETEG